MRPQFLLCRAMDSLWNRKVVSLLSSYLLSVDSGASPNFLHQFTGLLAPWSRCLDGNWEKDVCLFKSLILCGLVVCCLLGCSSLLSYSGAQMGLGESIGNSNVPNHLSSFGPRYYSCSLCAFAITSEEACWFRHSWDWCLFTSTPYDVRVDFYFRFAYAVSNIFDAESAAHGR